MSLSDIVRKFEESRRSTKIKMGAAGVAAAAAVGLAIVSLNKPEPYAPPEPAPVVQYVEAPSPVAKEILVSPTAIPPSPTPAVEPNPQSLTIEKETVTPQPTPDTKPVPTPTPKSNDYYVILEARPEGWGLIEYYADFPSKNAYFAGKGGIYSDFSDSEFFLGYLEREGVITPEQKNAYFLGKRIKLDLNGISVAVHSLLQEKEHSRVEDDLNLDKEELSLLLYYSDESLLESSNKDGYVTIRDGSLETVVTDEDGNTTRVKIDTVDAEEFLDYLLDQGKITVEQRNEYGETSSLELSLKDVKDAADFFDWAYSSEEGLYIGIDQDNINNIRDKLLPLFSSRD